MTDIERVRELCKEKKIPVSQLEKALGFSNGYLNPKKAKTISYQRMMQIAAFLDVPVSRIFMGPIKASNEKPASVSADGLNDKLNSLSPELREQFVRFLALAKADPERAARYLAFAAQELEAQK